MRFIFLYNVRFKVKKKTSKAGNAVFQRNIKENWVVNHPFYDLLGEEFLFLPDPASMMPLSLVSTDVRGSLNCLVPSRNAQHLTEGHHVKTSAAWLHDIL